MPARALRQSLRSLVTPARLAVGLAVLAVPVLVGCVGTPPPPDLGSACQIRSCVCEGRPEAFWRKPPTTDVQWTDRGRAFCPDGYSLKLATGKPTRR